MRLKIALIFAAIISLSLVSCKKCTLENCNKISQNATYAQMGIKDGDQVIWKDLIEVPGGDL